MAKTIISLLIVAIGFFVGLAIEDSVRGDTGDLLGIAVFILSTILAFLHSKKNPFKL